MMHPYRPGRIPVVLIHGTASSPARWAEIVNSSLYGVRRWRSTCLTEAAVTVARSSASMIGTMKQVVPSPSWLATHRSSGSTMYVNWKVSGGCSYRGTFRKVSP